MTQLDIQLNLDAEVQNFADDFNIDIVYPNTKYDPVEGTDFIRVSYVNGDVFQVSPMEDSLNRSGVVLQLDIFTNPNEGKYRTKQIVDDLTEHFKRGLVINNNNIKTRVTNFVLIDSIAELNKNMQIVRVTTRSDYEN